MIHLMNLQKSPFDKVKSGSKVIEVRLLDEKRRNLKLGDTIEFSDMSNSNNKVQVKISELLVYDSFKELVNDYGMEYYGYSENYPIEKFLDGMYEHYTEENEKKYGVVGIKIKLLN